MNSEQYLLRSLLQRLAIMVLFLVAIFIVAVISVAKGTINFESKEIFQAFFKASDNQLANQIIYNVRLPRILTGLLVGMNLAVAGALLQGILRNPLASPQIIGVNAGAGLAAISVMILLPGQIALIPPAAFGGALLATLLVYGLSRSQGNASTVHIILAGVAVAALLNALTSGLMILNSDELSVTYSWLLGGLSGRGWAFFQLLLPYSIAGLIAALLLSPKLNLFSLGDEVSQSLGVSVETYRIILIIVAAILAGCAVSVAGTIGFIGLIAPHMGRLLVGEDYRFLTPLSAMIGGVLLLLADLVARTIFQPVELPVGIITAILGTPFFIFLLYQRKNMIGTGR